MKSKEASYYHHNKEFRVQCQLCPHNCIIKPGKSGICKVRKNIEGNLYAENYGLLSAKHMDPIEKKPLYHYFPGREVLSIGTLGCNLKCQFCQNCEISQTGITDTRLLNFHSPEEIVQEALSIKDNIGIAYTYNEPIIWFEYIIEVAHLARKAGLKNILVSNGFINELPRHELIKQMDAFNIDLKGFTEEFYKNHTFSSLKDVKDTILEIYQAGKHLEITNLVIPSLNDDPDRFEEMVKWISEETDKNTVLHISRYFPHFKQSLPPTDLAKLEELYNIAVKYLNFVFIGNTGSFSIGRNTLCPSCGTIAIERSGYHTRIYGMNHSGECINCNEKILNHL
ncbi:MAG: AmmeMemoRadiSam system radical SAM enzyme [Bacteroidales bacterium]|nr:AmmeMemoRadiSam system radical SAM enzyme [Bacteroidales bacterium]